MQTTKNIKTSSNKTIEYTPLLVTLSPERASLSEPSATSGGLTEHGLTVTTDNNSLRVTEHRGAAKTQQYIYKNTNPSLLKWKISCLSQRQFLHVKASLALHILQP